MLNARMLPATCQTIDFVSVKKEIKSISSGIEKIERKSEEKSMKKSSKADGNLCESNVFSWMAKAAWENISKG